MQALGTLFLHLLICHGELMPTHTLLSRVCFYLCENEGFRGPWYLWTPQEILQWVNMSHCPDSHTIGFSLIPGRHHLGSVAATRTPIQGFGSVAELVTTLNFSVYCSLCDLLLTYCSLVVYLDC